MACGVWHPWLCPECAAEASVWGGRVDSVAGLQVHAAFRFEGPIRALLLAYKFQGYTSLGPRLARELTPVLMPLRLDAVVPVPLHWRRRWRRGHDQALGLARGLRFDLPRLTLVQALLRVRATAPQVGSGGAARRRNVAGAFAVRGGSMARLAGQRVVLIDDVVTTGATLRAAAAALCAAGARAPVGVAVAVSPRSVEPVLPRPATERRAT